MHPTCILLIKSDVFYFEVQLQGVEIQSIRSGSGLHIVECETADVSYFGVNAEGPFLG